MKKILSAVIALVMVCSMACAAFAAVENAFVPSIGAKPAPTVVTAEIYRGDKKIEDVLQDCLLITPVADAMANKEDERLPEEAKTTLLDVYNKLNNKSMVLPEDILKEAKLNPDSAVIRDLIDVTWVCEETPTHADRLAQDKDLKLKITFAMAGLEEYPPISVMTYKNGKWNAIDSVVYVGVKDGMTYLSCTFDHLCPVVFVVDRSVTGTGDAFRAELLFWTFTMVASAVALVVVVTKRRQNA